MAVSQTQPAVAAQEAPPMELTQEQKDELVKIQDASKIKEVTENVIQRQKEKDEKAKQYEESKIKVLILGSRHLASHIAYAMRDEAKITIVDSRNDPRLVYENPFIAYNVPENKFALHHFSELDFDRNFTTVLDVGDYDYIINTIAIHDEQYSNANPIQTMNVNCTFTQTLMNCIINKAGSNTKLVYISTDKVYGDTGCPSGVGSDEKGADRYWGEFRSKEDDICRPLGIKAISRKMQEDLIVNECKTYGLDYIVLRIGNMFGNYTPKDAIMNQMIIDGFQRSQIHIYGDQWASRDFVDIMDVAELVRKICQSRHFGKDVWQEIYNVGGQYPTRQFIWGLAQFVRTFFAGANISGLSPDFEELGYLKPFMSVKIRNMPPRFFEDSESAKVRIWMDSAKMENKLEFHPYQKKEWQDVFKETMLWNAAYNIGKPMDEVRQIRQKLARTR